MMRRRTAWRLGGFVTTLGVAAALTGLSVNATGAYFSDTHTGTMSGTFGAVRVDASGAGAAAGGAGGLEFNFQNLLPGEFQTATINIQNTGTGTEDVYLLFDDSNGEWSELNTLGTYGEFVVNGADYNNLNNHYPQGTAANPGQTNACGDATGAIAYLPAKNGLATLAPGASQSLTIKFRYTACISNSAYQLQQAFSHPLKYAIMAVQHGVDPTDPHNGVATYVLPTVASGYYT